MTNTGSASPVGGITIAHALHARVIQDARALDDLQKALSYLNEVHRLWEPLGDGPARNAIYKAAAVTYARPFIPGRSPGLPRVPAHPIRDYQDQPGFDRSVHDHLLELRNRFLAHADPYAFQPQLGRLVHQFEFDTGEHVTSTAALVTCVYSWDGLQDRGYLDQVRPHVDAFCKAIGAQLQVRLGELQKILLADSKVLGDPVAQRFSDRHRVESGQIARWSARDVLATTWKQPEEDVGGDRYRYRVANIVQRDPSLRMRSDGVAEVAGGPAEIDFS